MLLPADLDSPLDDMRSPGRSRRAASPFGQITGPSSNRLSAARASSTVRSAGQLLVGDLAQSRRLAGGKMAFGHHKKHRLARHNAQRPRPAAARHAPRASSRAPRPGHPPRRTATTPGAARTSARSTDRISPMRHCRTARRQGASAGPGSGDVVDIAGRPGDMQGCRIMGQGLAGMLMAGPSSTSVAMPPAVMEIAQQHVPRRLQPVGGRGAHVAHRREIRREERLQPGRDIGRQHLPDQRRLDRRRALRNARHAAEGDPGRADDAVLDRDVETSADSRDILVETLATACSSAVPGPCRGSSPLRRTRPVCGPACGTREKSLRAACRAARRPGAGAAWRPARSGRAARHRSASHWRCCHRWSRHCGPVPTAIAAQQFGEMGVERCNGLRASPRSSHPPRSGAFRLSGRSGCSSSMPDRKATGRQVAQLLGDPEPDIRRPGDQRGLRVGRIPRRPARRSCAGLNAVSGPRPGRNGGRVCPRIQSGTGASRTASAARTIGA